MKKSIIAAVVVGASALYLFMRTPTASAVPAGLPSPVVATVPSATTSGAAGSGAPPAGSAQTSAASSGSASSQGSQPSGKFKDGTYTGPSVNAYWGYVQVRATVSGGQLTNVAFLQYPNSHPASQYINSQVMPYLTQEALSAQSASVNTISGATMTSLGFRQSLRAALAKAANS